MGDPAVAKTPEMAKFEKAFLKKCQTHFSSLDELTKASCIAVINSQNNDAGVQSALHKAKVQADQQKAQLDQLSSKLDSADHVAKARSFVNEWVDKWQTKAMVVHAAVTMASAEYDLILSTKAAQPIIGQIIFNIAITMLPELAAAQPVFKALVVETHGLVNYYAPTIGTKGPNLIPAEKIGGFLDRNSGNILGAVKSGLEGNKNIDDASKQLAASYTAKNEVFKKMLGTVVSNLIGVTNLATIFYNYLDSTTASDPKSVVSGLMEANRLPHDPAPVNTNLLPLLSKQILYDMLRAYAQRYAEATSNSYVGTGKPYLRISSGFDSAQQDMILERFKSKVWKGAPTHPPVDTVDDIINKWKLPVTPVLITRAS